jgi:hypothetical protein
MATTFISEIRWTDTRDTLPEHYEYVLFADANKRVRYGMWEKNHRRFYAPGGHFDLADVRYWAQVPAELPAPTESIVHH